MRKGLLLSLLALASLAAQAQEQLARDINESVFRLPAMVPTKDGTTVARAMTVTQYKPDAMQRALTICKQYARTDCKLYAVDDDVVWKK